jgi:hypothetical protein
LRTDRRDGIPEYQGVGCTMRGTPARPEQHGSLSELVAQCGPFNFTTGEWGDLDCQVETPEPALHVSTDSNDVVLRLGASDML